MCNPAPVDFRFTDLDQLATASRVAPPSPLKEMQPGLASPSVKAMLS
jgi:hypothetical protein